MAARTAAAAIWTLFFAAAATVALALAGIGVASPAPAAHGARPAAAPAAPLPAGTPTAAAPRAAAAPAAPPPLVVRHILPIEGAMKLGEWHWDETGAPATGRLVVTADLKAGTLSAFRDGWEIGTAAILYGRDDKPTPLGAFPILEKDADHVSRTYGGAPMPYTLRLTNDGVAVHGSRGVAAGYATHGCISVPVPFARKLFAAARVGDLVIVTRGRTLAQGQAIVRGR